jgi:hypothetical protein
MTAIQAAEDALPMRTDDGLNLDKLRVIGKILIMLRDAQEVQYTSFDDTALDKDFTHFLQVGSSVSQWRAFVFVLLFSFSFLLSFVFTCFSLSLSGVLLFSVVSISVLPDRSRADEQVLRGRT